MKITAIKMLTLEQPEEGSPGHLPQLSEVPNLRRIQYRGGRDPHRRPIETPPSKPQERFLEVETDEGITGRVTSSTLDISHVGIIRSMALGENPLHRERFYQMFQKGTRWVAVLNSTRQPGWFGDFDNCLWDIAGKVAGLPVHSLIGKVRDSFPCYVTGGDMDVEGYLDSIEKCKQFGINAYKFHTYKGGKADIPIFHKVRETVGPDYELLNDPVCSYDLREAIEVGHVMEELGFIWLEEPFHEYKLHHYQELCRELDIPVMANETLMNDIGISTQWLLQGGTDLLRANARHGTTQVLKMAHFAELYDTNIEMNAMGGLYGHIHATLGCCIDNTGFYEYNGGAEGGANGLRKAGEPWGMVNAPLIANGKLAPSDLPGWGAEWDEKRFQSLIVSED